jgi:hypothetical protein
VLLLWVLVAPQLESVDFSLTSYVRSQLLPTTIDKPLPSIVID